MQLNFQSAIDIAVSARFFFFNEKKCMAMHNEELKVQQGALCEPQIPNSAHRLFLGFYNFMHG